ncbi:MAG TPA: cytochrome c nitrite reductase small subunit [Thermoanaerobaculia bacterium]|nr:cytochrome c nitrite reductase small subunit [Thermoanaerobaculia bacterium]
MTRTAVALVLGGLLGLAAGIGGYTFLYAKGASYLTNDPAACANCHIMQPYYDQWRASTHRAVAVCNDCHTPPGLIPKYATKASNGFWHSYGFTTGRFHEPLRIKESNRRVTEQACRKCHAEITQAIDPAFDGPHQPRRADQELSCLRCHNQVGHF